MQKHEICRALANEMKRWSFIAPKTPPVLSQIYMSWLRSGDVPYGGAKDKDGRLLELHERCHLFMKLMNVCLSPFGRPSARIRGAYDTWLRTGILPSESDLKQVIEINLEQA